MTQRTFLLAFISGLLALPHAGCKRRDFEAEVLEPRRRAADIQAALGDGRAFQLRSLTGKVVLLAFGYTSCPDVCPVTLSRIKALYASLGEQSRDLTTVFITVDPERDTPERLHAYVQGFDARIFGLSLDPLTHRRVLAAYGITAARREATMRPPGGSRYYAIDHSSGFLILDRNGWVRLHAPHDLPVDKLAHDVRVLLAEPADSAAGLRVEDAQVRVGDTGVGAAYLRVVNRSDRPDRLLSVESASAGRVELHQILHEGGVARMIHHPDGFPIPARSELTLRPGGRHLMLYDVRPGEPDVPLTLHFESAAPMDIRAQRIDPTSLSAR